jgi:hypothetical protein
VEPLENLPTEIKVQWRQSVGTKPLSKSKESSYLGQLLGWLGYGCTCFTFWVAETRLALWLTGPGIT